MPGATAMNLYSRSLLLLGVAIAQTYGAIYNQASQLPTDAYDCIVVGGTFPIPRTHGTNSSETIVGGTAGNVVANCLTEDINIQVLVLEAGGR